MYYFTNVGPVINVIVLHSRNIYDLYKPEEAISGPVPRARAPRDLRVPKTAPRASSGACAAAIDVIHDTANAVAINKF